MSPGVGCNSTAQGERVMRFLFKHVRIVEAQWLSGRMPDSRSRKHRHESPYTLAPLVATRCGVTPRQNKIIVLVLCNKP